MTNDPAFVESLKVSPIREGKSKIDALDLKARGQTSFYPAGGHDRMGSRIVLVEGIVVR